jgi:hypothetical protein
MATLATNKLRTFGLDDVLNDLPVVATDIIYQGAAVGDNASGYARPLVAGDPFKGFAEAKADNATGAAGAITVNVRQKGNVPLAVTGVTGVADVGKAVYASDDDTFTLTASTNSYVGRVSRHIASTTVLVEFDASKGGFGTATQLTDSSGGTAADTIAAIGGSYNQAEIRNAVASLAAKINHILRVIQ